MIDITEDNVSVKGNIKTAARMIFTFSSYPCIVGPVAVPGWIPCPSPQRDSPSPEPLARRRNVSNDCAQFAMLPWKSNSYLKKYWIWMYCCSNWSLRGAVAFGLDTLASRSRLRWGKAWNGKWHALRPSWRNWILCFKNTRLNQLGSGSTI